MNRIVAMALAEALNDECNCEVKFRDSYSGRGMHGQDTCAISGEFSWCDVAVAWAYCCTANDSFNPDDLGFTWDAMGHGTVIY
tara:strand:- start:1055 stop:1303 length:249 start_codon:yes stop_codon:yes gene_type:complete